MDNKNEQSNRKERIKEVVGLAIGTAAVTAALGVVYEIRTPNEPREQPVITHTTEYPGQTTDLNGDGQIDMLDHAKFTAEQAEASQE